MWFVLLPRQQIFLFRSFFYFWLLHSRSYKTMPPYKTHSIFYKISQIKWINYGTNTKFFLYILTSESWFEWTPTSFIIVDKQIITQYWGWPVFYLKVSSGMTPSPLLLSYTSLYFISSGVNLSLTYSHMYLKGKMYCILVY